MWFATPGEESRRRVGASGALAPSPFARETASESMRTSCTFCGCAVEAHDPVFVEELQDGTRTDAGAFCNYACLAQHIETEDLESGAICRIDLE